MRYSIFLYAVKYRYGTNIQLTPLQHLLKRAHASDQRSGVEDKVAESQKPPSELWRVAIEERGNPGFSIRFTLGLSVSCAAYNVELRGNGA